MRTKTTILNFITSFLPWIILAILGFIKIKYFIQYFGSEMNGLVQLVGQVYAYLGLMELGFGSAIIFKLYKPFAENDRKKISELFLGSRKIYKMIGVSMFLIGTIISIIIPYFITNLTIPIYYVTLVFLLFNIDYFTLYFFGLSYQALLAADQKQYKINIIQNGRAIIFKTIELILIISKVDLLLILSLGIISNIISNIILVKMVKKKYPWLDRTVKPDLGPLKMTKDVIVHKLSGLVFSKTDSIVLALFSGLSLVSIYGAYNYIITSIGQVITFIFTSSRDGFGNLFASNNIDNYKKGRAFKEMLILTFYLAILMSAIFNVSVIPFIAIWINNSYKIGYAVVILFSISLWYSIIVKPLNILKNANGLYKESKWYTLAQALLNLTLSIILVFKYGILGILLATVISQVVITLPFELNLVYKRVLHEKIKTFIKIFIFNLLFLILIIILDFEMINVFNFYQGKALYNWIFDTFIIGIIDFTIVTVVFYFATKEFKILITRFYNIFREKVVKK